MSILTDETVEILAKIAPTEDVSSASALMFPFCVCCSYFVLHPNVSVNIRVLSSCRLLQEVTLLKSHDGPVLDLGEAELLLLQLDAIPMFRTKLKLLQTISSFDAGSLEHAAKTYSDACAQLCLSQSLVKLFSVLLSHANFMNVGSGAAKITVCRIHSCRSSSANVAFLQGFKLTSLPKFADCRFCFRARP